MSHRNVSFNLLYSDAFSHTDRYNKNAIVHLKILGVIEYDAFLSLKIVFTLTNSED